MTTITLPRAVVEQALEALELGYDAAKSEADQYHAAMAGFRPERHAQMDAEVQQIAAAITALRAALAQQAEPVKPVAHRVVAGALFDFMGWLTSRRERLVLSSTDDAAPAADAIKDFAEMRGLSLDDAKVQDWNAAPPQQAEPVEPVAWVRLEAWKSGQSWPDDCFTALPAEGLTPLYTAPPQRKPLTEEEIDAEWRKAASEEGFTTVQFVRNFARAIERAHGITGDNTQPTTSMDEIQRLRAERDALAQRLREVRALLADTTERVMNTWAEQRLARHGIPMPEGDPK